MSGAFIFVISCLRSFCYRELFAYDRNRARRDFVWTGICERARCHCIAFSGIAFSSRRFDNTWSKYIFHGDRRTGRLFGIYKLCQK